MKFQAFLNHELDPDTKALVGSLSGNRAVGAFVATEWIGGRKGYSVVPVGAVELLDDPAVVELARNEARAALDELKASEAPPPPSLQAHEPTTR